MKKLQEILWELNSVYLLEINNLKLGRSLKFSDLPTK